MAMRSPQEDKLSQVGIPDSFFRQALFEISDLEEMRLTMYIYWRLDHQEGPLHTLRLSDLLKDEALVQSMGGGPSKSRKAIEEALHKAVKRGSLLQAEIPHSRGRDFLICLNSPKGKAALDALRRGEWKLDEDATQAANLFTPHPNIFQQYEVNIGPLTPMLADVLKDAEKTYPADWIEDAFRIAVERNKRSWHYVEAILRHWQEGGRDDRKDQSNRHDSEEARRRYKEWEQ